MDLVGLGRNSRIIFCSLETWAQRHPPVPRYRQRREDAIATPLIGNPNRSEDEVLKGLFARVIVDEGHRLMGGGLYDRAASIIELETFTDKFIAQQCFQIVYLIILESRIFFRMKTPSKGGKEYVGDSIHLMSKLRTQFLRDTPRKHMNIISSRLLWVSRRRTNGRTLRWRKKYVKDL